MVGLLMVYSCTASVQGVNKNQLQPIN